MVLDVPGTLVCALTSNIGLLIAARALQGAASAVVPLAIGILRDELPKERIGSGMALMSSSLGIGSALGVPASTAIVQNTDWHVMFWAVTGLGVVVLALVWAVVPESPVRNPGRFDVPGALLLGVGLVCLLLAVSQGENWGWTSPLVLGLFGTAAVVLAGWWWVQRRTAEPLVDPRLAARPGVALPHLAGMFTGFAFYANALITTQLVQAPEGTGYGLGLDVMQTGLVLLPGGVIMLCLSPVSARMSAAWGPRITLAVGTAVIALGHVLRIADSRQLWAIMVGAAVISAGTALAFSALPALIVAAVPAARTASVNGVNVLSRTVGQAVSSAAVAAILAGGLGALNLPTMHAFQLAFVMAGAVAVLASLTALTIPVRRDRKADEEVPQAEPAAERVSGT